MSTSFNKTLYLARHVEQHCLTRCLGTPSTVCHLNNALSPHSGRHASLRQRSHNFSTSRQCKASEKKGSEPLHKNPRVAKMMEEQRKQGMVNYEDMGIQPGTFIMPFGKNLPSWISNFKGRLKLEKKRTFAWARQVAMLLFYKWYVTPRPKARRAKIPGVAQELHKSMYEHLASGNLNQIEHLLASGLQSSLRQRIGQRPAGTRMKWVLHKYLSPSKLVFWQANLAPAKKKGETNYERDGLVQAIVRIHSLQSLQHVRKVQTGTKEVLVDSQGRELTGKGADGMETSDEGAMRHAKELVEYIVIQKSLKKSREGPWKVWGTTEESTLERLDREERRQQQARGGASLKGDVAQSA